jgi:hypothetical protein
MRILILILAVLSGITSLPLSASPQDWEMIPDIVSDDFETGATNAWETYPFFQDMGFNPTLSCTREPVHDGQYSLSQTFIPTDTDYPTDVNWVGIMKRIHLTTEAESRVKLALFVGSDRRPQRIELSLCSVDGRQFIAELSSPSVNEWIYLDIAVSGFRSGGDPLGPDTPIEAITITAEFGIVSPDRSYSLNLDSFKVNGKRRRQFTPVVPEGVCLKHFNRTILHRHYSAGDFISVSAMAEEMTNGNALMSVDCSIVDPNGITHCQDLECFDDGTQGDKAAGDGIWSRQEIYKVTDTDPPGRWHINLRGKTQQDSFLESTFDFLISSPTFSANQHPRLFFTSKELMKRAEIRQESPLLKQLFSEADELTRKRLAEETVSRHPEFHGVNAEYLGGGLFSPSWNQFDRWINGLDASISAKDCAFLYAFMGDEEMGERGKEFLLHVCRFGTWNHPWMDSHGIHMYYPVGFTAYRVAIAFDLLYPLLTLEERQVVREALIRNAIIPAYKGEVLDNHIPSNISNHLGVSCTGALLAAIVLLGEDLENPYLEPFLSGILSKLEAHIDAGYLPDGSYAEPFSYYHMEAEMTVKAVACLLRTFGIDWTVTKGIGNAWQYSIYTSTPSGEGCLDMGDGLDYWGNNGTKPLIWAASRTRDEVAWDRYLWTRGPEISKKLEADFYDYLWAPLNLEPASVTYLPTSKWFWAKGFACFRGGWGEDDLHLLYKAGPHSNHYHLDQGNILLRYGGEILLDEGGYADYYKNGYYHSFYEQAVAHNTLLVGRYPESQGLGDLYNQVKALNRYPRIFGCSTGSIIDSLESELSPVYKGRLNQFNRSIIFLKPDYFILYDTIAADHPELFQWLFHARCKESIQAGTSTCYIRRPHAKLRMEIIQPRAYESHIMDHPDSEKAVLIISTTESSSEARFLSVMIPSMEKNQNDRDQWLVSPVGYPGWIGVQVRREGVVDEICFKEDRGGLDTLGCYRTDADKFVVSMGPQGRITRLWARNAKSFTKYLDSGDSALQVTADKAVTFALQWRDSVLEIESDFTDDLKLVIKPIDQPASVHLHGENHPFEYDAVQRSVSVFSKHTGTH